MKYDKKTFIGASVLALILIIVFFVATRHKSPEVKVESQVPEMPIVEQPKPITHRKVVAPSEAAPLSYAEAIEKFRGGYVLQFDGSCKSHPISLAVANKSEVLLDNRGSDVKTIMIGDMKYSIDPYGYKIISLSIPKAPQTFTVDCNEAQNVSTIIVQ